MISLPGVPGLDHSSRSRGVAYRAGPDPQPTLTCKIGHRKADARTVEIESRLFGRTFFSLDQFPTAIFHLRAVWTNWLKGFVSPLRPIRNAVKRCRAASKKPAGRRLHTVMTTYPGATEPKQLRCTAAKRIRARMLQSVAEPFEVNATDRANLDRQWRHCCGDNLLARTVEHDGMRLITVQIIVFSKPDTALSNKLVACKGESAPGIVCVARGMEDREIIASQLRGLHCLEFVQHPVDSAIHRRRRT